MFFGPIRKRYLPCFSRCCNISLMEKYFLQLQKELLLFPNRDNLVCFLIFGSTLTDYKNAKDFDGIVVVKKVDSTLKYLFNILRNRYSKLDINIYTQGEILSNLSFYTREFKLEYLARGLCIYGENIFQKEYKKVSDYEYRQSMLVRSIERLQIVRQKYFSGLASRREKLNYIKKYFLRISKSVLILQDIENDPSAEKLEQDEINKKLIKIGVLDPSFNTGNIKTLDEQFDFFDIVISKALIKCKRDFDLKYSEHHKVA